MSQKRLKAGYRKRALGTVGVPRREVVGKRFNYDKTLHRSLRSEEDEDKGIRKRQISHERNIHTLFISPAILFSFFNVSQLSI